MFILQLPAVIWKISEVICDTLWNTPTLINLWCCQRHPYPINWRKNQTSWTSGLWFVTVPNFSVIFPDLKMEICLVIYMDYRMWLNTTYFYANIEIQLNTSVKTLDMICMKRTALTRVNAWHPRYETQVLAEDNFYYLQMVYFIWKESNIFPRTHRTTSI